MAITSGGEIIPFGVDGCRVLSFSRASTRERERKKGKETISKEPPKPLQRRDGAARNCQVRITPLVDRQPSSPSWKNATSFSSFPPVLLFLFYFPRLTAVDRCFNLRDSRHIRFTHRSIIIPSTCVKDSERSLSM